MGILITFILNVTFMEIKLKQMTDSICRINVDGEKIWLENKILHVKHKRRCEGMLKSM
jgi:hypothetical protein